MARQASRRARVHAPKRTVESFHLRTCCRTSPRQRATETPRGCSADWSPFLLAARRLLRQSTLCPSASPVRSIPRGRGNLVRALEPVRLPRSIPAWAGETGKASLIEATIEGLSPRGRGNPASSPRPAGPTRSIPAWAGKPGRPARYSRGLWGLSPRGRGNRTHDQTRYAVHGSIPAWAGKPHPGSTTATRARVYPRVGGETRNPGRLPAYGRGLSPRGRGNRVRSESAPYHHGSIPAWAGKPFAESQRPRR